MRKRLLVTTCLLSLALLMPIASCKPAKTPLVGKAINGLTGMPNQKEKRLSTAAQNAIAEGKTGEALEHYKDLYDDRSTDPDVALNYAQLLRKSGNAEKALDVLKPLITYGIHDEMRDKVDPVLINEYAAAQIETGHFDDAKTLLDRVLEDNTNTGARADAYNLLGIALDAEGHHSEAEPAYREALDGWKGDPTSVLNNLGLCLAAQGRFDESLMTLRQALVRASHKTEVARNIQMVTDLRNSLLPKAPVSVTTIPEN